MSRSVEGAGSAAVRLLAAASGCAALIHQMVWVRRTVDLAGADAATFAAVAGAFFIGFAIGGALSVAVRSRESRALWKGVSLAEAGIALAACVLLQASAGADWLLDQDLPAALVRIGLPLALILPSSLLMGLVTPLMTRAALASGRGGAIGVHGWNLAGGLLGILLALGLLLPTLGTVAAGLAAAAVNLACAAAAWLLANGTTAEATEPPPDTGQPAAFPFPVATAAFLSGFLVLGGEVVVQLQWTQVTINAQYSAGLVLFCVLGALALGAWLVARFPAISLEQAAVASCIVWAFQPILFRFAFGGLVYQPYAEGWAGYLGQLVLPSVMTLLLPFVAAGMVYPQLLRRLPVGAERSTLAWLLLVNGIGGWLGAELFHGFFLPRFGLWGASCVLAAGQAVLILAALPRLAGLGLAGLGWTVALAAWALVGHLPQVQPRQGVELVGLAVGREGVVAVTEGTQGDRRLLFNNSYTLGGTLATANQERQAHLPVLLQGSARSVATLGVATGGTAGGLVPHPGLEEVHAIELSPLVLRFARTHFASHNRAVLSDPRVRPVLADARLEILRNPGAYDVVIGDLFLPWRTGEGRLFSVEHFEAVRRSLRPGGLFCQWLPLYQLTEEQFDVIAAGFLDVFPGAFVIRCDFYLDLPVVGLVGGRSWESIDWKRMEAACAALRDAGITDPLVRHPEGVALLLGGPLREVTLAKRNRLDNAWLEWDAGRNLVTGESPWFVGQRFALRMREWIRSRAEPGESAPGAALAAGEYLLTLEVAAENPELLDSLAAQAPKRLPRRLLEDDGADWNRWPGRVRGWQPEEPGTP